MSTAELRAIAQYCPADSLDGLLAWIRHSHPVVSIKVSDLLWQRVRSEKDRRIAEKLDRWLVKSHGRNVCEIESSHFRAD